MRLAWRVAGVYAVASGLLLNGVMAAGWQGRSGTASSGYSRVISPVAVATVLASLAADGARTLDVLVLWRGSPGWFFRGSGSASSGGGSGAWRYERARFGGVQLELGFDITARTAIVQDKRVELKDANVIFVDGVDTTEGPVVAGTARVDPILADEKRIEPLLKSSPQILAFLRCDVRLDAPGQDAAVQRICAAIAGEQSTR